MAVKAPAQTVYSTYISDTANAYGHNYKKPQFYNGDSCLKQYLKTNAHYPDAARENNIQGKVRVQFLVDEKGNISHARVIRGIGGGCDEEALRTISLMPAWQPATYKGKPVRAVEIMPVIFRLE